MAPPRAHAPPLTKSPNNGHVADEHVATFPEIVSLQPRGGVVPDHTVGVGLYVGVRPLIAIRKPAMPAGDPLESALATLWRSPNLH